MGREIDEELIITPPELTRTIETAPAYSEELLKTAADKNYKLKTLRRDKQQAEKDSKDTSKYDGQIKASKVDMQLADVSTEEEKVNIANDLKKKLDAINTAAAEYQNKKDAKSNGSSSRNPRSWGLFPQSNCRRCSYSMSRPKWSFPPQPMPTIWRGRNIICS